METNKYSWNQTLKFSWGHIVAFVGLIFISYVVYMGDFYLNGGDFKASVFKVAAIDIALLITFIGAQITKGVDEKFDRSIIIERILICLCPIVFIWAMIPYNHFWGVFHDKEQIETQFNNSILGAKQMFEDYDTYAHDRIEKYEHALSTVLQEKTDNPSTYSKAGFTGSDDYLKKQNYIRTLELQLLSQNTDSIKTVAIAWIDEANQGASVWNAFLVGNIKQIKDAIASWHSTLVSFSTPVLSNENVLNTKVEPFDRDGASIKVATSGLDALTEMYETKSTVQINTIITGFVLFLMLMFPYFLQKRNTRATGLYFLIPGVKAKSNIKHDNSASHRKIRNKVDEDQTVITDHSDSDGDDIFSGTF